MMNAGVVMSCGLVLLLVPALAGAESQSDQRGTTTFVVTNQDFQNYLIDGQPDPDLT